MTQHFQKGTVRTTTPLIHLRKCWAMELFYTEPENINGSELRIVGDEARHIARVLRHKVGDTIFVTDGRGFEYRTVIQKIDRDSIIGEILNERRKPREPIKEITLAQGLIKGNRMDTLIEKSTELGVSEIIGLITERTVVKPVSQKVSRYKKIAITALKSSTRTILPKISLLTFQELVAKIRNYEIGLMAYEKESSVRLSDINLQNVRNLLLVIGPEGGFSEQERDLAETAGFRIFSLGPRRLRSETAGIAALSLLLHKLGEI